MHVLIIGSGEGGRLALDLLRKSEEHLVVGFVDDNKKLKGKTIDGVKVLGTTKDLKKLRKEANGFIVGIGCSNLKARMETFKLAKRLGFAPINAIHKTAIIDESVQLGEGLTIFAGTVINREAKIGDNVTIYSGTVVEHQCEIGDHVYIGPGAHLSGNVKVGENTFIGVGADFVQGLRIGKNSIIGAGAVVLKNVPDNVVAAGVPLRVLRKRTKDEVGVRN